MEKKQYPILDIMKFVSALLVVAIHCAPFIQIHEEVNVFFVQIIARLAVPFFFITSGFLFFRKINPEKGIRNHENVRQLKQYWHRIFHIYVIWSILYLPLLIISWIQGGFNMGTILRLFRDFLCNGTYYHLWFLPALLLAIPLVYALYCKFSRKVVLLIFTILYFVGMTMNIYGALLQDIPGISSLYDVYIQIFVSARNGLFFGPIFITLGIYANDFTESKYAKQSFLACLLSFSFLVIECFALQYFGIMHDLSSMYSMLIPTLFFFFIFLLQIPCKAHKIDVTLRHMSLLIYVSHIYFIFIFLQVFQMPNIIVYIFSIVGSCMLSYWILRYAKRYSILKVLYK